MSNRLPCGARSETGKDATERQHVRRPADAGPAVSGHLVVSWRRPAATGAWATVLGAVGETGSHRNLFDRGPLYAVPDATMGAGSRLLIRRLPGRGKVGPIS